MELMLTFRNQCNDLQAQIYLLGQVEARRGAKEKKREMVIKEKEMIMGKEEKRDEKRGMMEIRSGDDSAKSKSRIDGDNRLDGIIVKSNDN